MQIQHFNFLRKIDTIGRANFFASSTQSAIVYINGSRFGTTNAERNKSSLTSNQSKLILVAHIYRTSFLAQLASGTVFHANVTGLLCYFSSKFIVAQFANIAHFASGKNGNVRVTRYFRNLGSSNTGRTIECRKYLTKHNHFATYRKLFIHQQHFETCVSQIQCSFATGNTGTNNQCIVGYIFN